MRAEGMSTTRACTRSPPPPPPPPPLPLAPSPRALRFLGPAFSWVVLGVGGRFWGSSWLVLAGARSHRYFIGEKPLTLKPLTLKPFSDRIRLRTSRSHKFRTLPAWKKARCMDIQTCHSCSAQNSAGSTALMRTEPSSSSSVHMTTAQHRSPVRPLVTATPSRVPFFFTVSVPASESSSRRSTSPSP